MNIVESIFNSILKPKAFVRERTLICKMILRVIINNSKLSTVDYQALVKAEKVLNEIREQYDKKVFY